MKFIDKLERKYGRFGIPSLTMYIIISYVLGYALLMINPAVLSMLSLNVTKILHGQIWRLVTWIIYPPSTGNPILFFLMILLFYYPVSNHLERTWGSFRFTLYIFSGMLFTVISAFLLYFITGGTTDMLFGGSLFSTYYISLSIFLAYALSYPDMHVLIMYVLPVKMKWMAIVYVVLVGFDIVGYISRGVWFMALPIVASLLNFILFFLGTRDMSRYNPKEIHRRKEFKRAVAVSSVVDMNGKPIARHKCAICGRTELDNPNLEFRFCSKCNGNYEYCQDHLYTHTHIK